MAAFEVPPLSIEKGTDFKATFNILNDDGTVQPLNGYTAVAKLRKHSSSSTSYPFSVQIVEVDDSIEIGMAKSITSTLPVGRCYFDIFLTYSGLTYRPIFGTIIVTDTISKDE